jgi:hypothetical protein
MRHFTSCLETKTENDGALNQLLRLGCKEKQRCSEVLANTTAGIFRENEFGVIRRPLIYLVLGSVWEATAYLAGRRKAMSTNNSTPR